MARRARRRSAVSSKPEIRRSRWTLSRAPRPPRPRPAEEPSRHRAVDRPLRRLGQREAPVVEGVVVVVVRHVSLGMQHGDHPARPARVVLLERTQREVERPEAARAGRGVPLEALHRLVEECVGGAVAEDGEFDRHGVTGTKRNARPGNVHEVGRGWALRAARSRSIAPRRHAEPIRFRSLARSRPDVLRPGPGDRLTRPSQRGLAQGRAWAQHRRSLEKTPGARARRLLSPVPLR